MTQLHFIPIFQVIQLKKYPRFKSGVFPHNAVSIRVKSYWVPVQATTNLIFIFSKLAEPCISLQQ